MRLFLIGNIGSFNLGDDAILVAFIKYFDTLLDSTRDVYVYSKNNYIVNNFGSFSKIKAHLVSRIGILRAFVKSHFIIICGGDYLDDFGSLITRLRAFLIMFSIAFVSRFSFKKFCMINNGFRANSTIGLSFQKIILKLADRVSARDEFSYRLISEHKHPTEKGFDTAVLWQDFIFFRKKESIFSIDKKIKVGLSISPVYLNFFSDPSKDLQIAKEMVAGLKRVLSERSNIELYFLAFNTSRNSGDLYLIRNMINMIGPFFKKRIKVIAYDGKIYDFLQYFYRLNFIVCCKYHSILLSYLFEKPMIVLCFHPKNFALVNDIKLPKKSLCSPSDILNGRFYSILIELLNDFNGFKAEYSTYEAKKRAIAGILHCIKNVV